MAGLISFQLDITREFCSLFLPQIPPQALLWALIVCGGLYTAYLKWKCSATSLCHEKLVLQRYFPYCISQKGKKIYGAAIIQLTSSDGLYFKFLALNL